MPASVQINKHYVNTSYLINQYYFLTIIINKHFLVKKTIEGINMLKKRHFNTDIFQSAKLHDAENETSPNVKWLFLGLIAHADREGRLEADIRLLRSKIFPYSDMHIEEISKMMDALEKCGVIKNYSVDNKKYCLVVNFIKHQYIIKAEKQSKLPGPKESK